LTRWVAQYLSRRYDRSVEGRQAESRADRKQVVTVRALRFAEFGSPSVLRIEEVAIPEPCEGEALVHVRAAAINPSDIADVAGRFKNTTLPRTPGRDFAGVVVKGKHHEGEEVWGSAPKLGIDRDGSHAEYVVVRQRSGFLTLRRGHLS
jgi:NADPH:quinone reductase-like Zn-dependent oxidoreductase